jgi:mannose-6-phosphate isomerase-like protein (cupin superfamily)
MNHKREATEISQGRRYYYPVQKDYATFLETSEQTGGGLTLIEIEVSTGGGNGPHYHKTYDEHFEVIEGTLEVLLGKDTHTLHQGQKAVAPSAGQAGPQERHRQGTGSEVLSVTAGQHFRKNDGVCRTLGDWQGSGTESVS